MALTVNYIKEETGLTIPNAYVRVDRFRGDKTTVIFDYCVYVNVQTRLDGKNPVFSGLQEISTPNTDILPALYTYLKTLPDFANAIDC